MCSIAPKNCKNVQINFSKISLNTILAWYFDKFVSFTWCKKICLDFFLRVNADNECTKHAVYDDFNSQAEVNNSRCFEYLIVSKVMVTLLPRGIRIISICQRTAYPA